MHSQSFHVISALLFLTTVVSGIPAIKISNLEENCGVTTVYVTVAPTSSATATYELQETSAINYGAVSTPVSANSAESDISASVSGSSIGLDSSSTTLLTSTVHRTVFLTNTVTGAGYTRTETIEVTYSTSSTALLDSSAITSIEEETTHTATAVGSNVYPTSTVETLPKCSGDLAICPETSVLNSLSSSTFEDVSVSQPTSSASPPSEVYVVETLTVIPLESIPSASASSILSMGSTVQTTSTSTITFINSAASIPVMAEVISTTSLRTTALNSYSRGYSMGGSQGWNLSIASSSIISGTASVGTVSSTTLVVDALESSAVTFNASTTITASSLNSSLIAVVSSQAALTESCSEDISATSTANAGKYTLISMTIGSNVGNPYTVSTSSHTPWNSTTMSSLVFSSGSVAPGGIISSASYRAQLTSSGLATEVVSSSNSASSEFSPESSFSLILTSITTMTNISSSIITPFPTTVSPAIGSGTLEASPLNTTYSSLLSTSHSETTETEKGHTSLLSLATYSHSPSMATSIHSIFTIYSSQAEDNCTDSVASTSYSATFPTLTSSILTFTNAASSVDSATALNVTSVSSSSSISTPQPTVCGEQGTFTLNFDDIPPLAVKDNSTADPMPLFSPYHQFFFSDGWTIVPPPTDPYLPSSGRLLVEFLADPDSTLGYTGAVGNGENSLRGCFNFNALGMSLGCDSKGPSCDWQFTGLRYNNFTQATDTVTSQNMSTAACAALSNCTLVPIVLESTFQSLTELRVNVTVLGVEKIWWLDDLNLSWFDDSCEAGLCRGGHNQVGSQHL